MRHGHTGANAGRARLLARQKRVQHLARVEAKAPRGGLGDQRQGLMLGARAQPRRDGPPVKQFFDAHGLDAHFRSPTPEGWKRPTS